MKTYRRKDTVEAIEIESIIMGDADDVTAKGQATLIPLGGGEPIELDQITAMRLAPFSGCYYGLKDGKPFVAAKDAFEKQWAEV